MHAGKIHKALFSVSAITDAVSVAFTLLMLLLLRKDMHFYFLVGVLQLLIIFFLAGLLLLAVLVLPSTSVSYTHLTLPTKA